VHVGVPEVDRDGVVAVGGDDRLQSLDDELVRVIPSDRFPAAANAPDRRLETVRVGVEVAQIASLKLHARKCLPSRIAVIRSTSRREGPFPATGAR